MNKSRNAFMKEGLNSPDRKYPCVITPQIWDLMHLVYSLCVDRVQKVWMEDMNNLVVEQGSLP